MEEHAHELRGELEGRLATVRAAVSRRHQPAGDRAGAPRPAAGRRLLDPGDDLDRRRRGRRRRPRPEPGRGRLGRARGLRADVVIVMPDGSVEDSQRAGDGALGADRHRWAPAGPSRSRPQPPSPPPGPRLVDGVELLGHLLHPDLVDPPGNTAFSALTAPVTRPAAAATAQATASAPTTETTAQGHQPPARRCAAAGRACRARRRRSPGRRAAADQAAEVGADADVVRAPRLKTRLITIRKPNWPASVVHAAAAGDDEGGAEEAEDRAGGAEGEARRVEEQQRAERPGQAARRSRGATKRSVPSAGSSSRPRKKSSSMLKQMWKKAGVEEAAGHQPVPLPFANGPGSPKSSTIAPLGLLSPPPPPAISTR